VNIILRDEIIEWAKANMDDKSHDSIYPMFEKIWVNQIEHMLLKLRLCVHDSGADIVVLSCSASYGLNEDDWHGTRLCNAKSVEQIQNLFDWLRMST